MMENRFVNVIETDGEINGLNIDKDTDLYIIFNEDCDANIVVRDNCRLNLFSTYNNRIKINLNIILKENSYVNHTEAFIGNKDESFEVNTKIIHKGMRSNANVMVKGVLFDNARSINHGRLRIEKDAQKANTFLSEHVLLLSKDAKANAIPSLEIEADDVIARHSASVTQVDRNKIFYLASKGISENEAKRILIGSFLEGCFSRIDGEDMRNKYRNIVLGKWQ